MLKIDSDPQFTAQVLVNTLAIKGDFEVRFRVIPNDEAKAIGDAADDGWKQLLHRVVVRFAPVEIGDKRLQGDNEGDLAQLIRWPGVGQAMLARYWSGLYEAAQGN